MTSIFISHASPDRPFALRLGRSLRRLDYLVWVDVQQIHVGESIPRRVAEAVERADYLIVVLSKHSIASAWSEAEWEAKFWDELVSRRTIVLPVVIDNCPIPLFLRPKRHADFRSEYAVGFAQLAITLDKATSTVLQTVGNNGYGGNTEVTKRYFVSQSEMTSLVPLCYTQDAMIPSGRLVEVNVELEVPYVGRIAGIWKPDEHEQDAAWELYVELVTRISVAELSPNDGLLRESLSSLYSIFTTTRHILRTYGPSVARPKKDSQLSFGYLAISMLNYVLRPVLAKWHPLLLDYEHQRTASVSALQHEAAWEHAAELRQVLNQVRLILLAYTNILAHISRVPSSLPQ